MSAFEERKKILAERALLRGSSGLYFLEDILRDMKGGTDVAFSRSLYILFSFNFELILKSILILEGKHKDEKTLGADIKNHNLDLLSKIVKKEDLIKYGIEEIKKEIVEGFAIYSIKMESGEVVVLNDLVDVRYDFMRDDLRKVDQNEIVRIKKELQLILFVVEKIKKSIY